MSTITMQPMERVYAALIAGQITPQRAGLPVRFAPDYAALAPLEVSPEQLLRYNRLYWRAQFTGDTGSHARHMEQIIADESTAPDVLETMRVLARHSRVSRLEFDGATVLDSPFGDNAAANAVLREHDFALLRYVGLIMPGGAACAPTTGDVEGALASVSIEMAAFYKALIASQRALRHSGVPLWVHQTLHAANADVMMQDLHAVARTAAGVAAGTVMDAAFIIAMSDYSGLPALPEVVHDMLVALEVSVLGRGIEWFGSGRTDVRGGEVLDAVLIDRAGSTTVLDAPLRMTPRQFFEHVGVTADEIMAYAQSRPFYDEAEWFNEINLLDEAIGRSTVSYTTSPDAVRNATLQRFTAGYGSELPPPGTAPLPRTSAQRQVFGNQASFARHLVFDALAAGAQYAPRPTKEPSAETLRYGYVLAAMAEFVRRNLAPVLQQVPPHYTAGSAGESPEYIQRRNFLRRTARFDFLDALRFEAAVRAPQMVDTHLRASIQSDIVNRMTALAVSNRFFRARGPMMVEPYVAPPPQTDDMTYEQAYEATMKAAGIGKIKRTAFERMVRRVDGRGGDYRNFDERRVSGDFWIIEPSVRWTETGNPYLLCDPDFYLYYMLVRLLWKARWGPGAQTEDDIAMRRAAIDAALSGDSGLIPALINEKLHRLLTMPSKQEVQALAQRCIVNPRKQTRDTLAGTTTCRLLPRYTAPNRRAMLALLLAQLHRRRGLDVPRSLGVQFAFGPAVARDMDMDRLIALASGQAYSPNRLLFPRYATTPAQLSALGRAIEISRSLPRPRLSPAALDIDENVGEEDVLLRCAVPPGASVQWLWAPSRDFFKRTFALGPPAVADASGVVTLEVAPKDGLEGLYICVAGDASDGYLQFDRALRLYSRCERTHKRYEEATNTPSAAIWTWNGKRLTGWHAPMKEPYSFAAPRYDDDPRPMLGDMLRDDAGLPGAMAEAQKWIRGPGKQIGLWVQFAAMLTTRLLAPQHGGCGADLPSPVIETALQLYHTVRTEKWVQRDVRITQDVAARCQQNIAKMLLEADKFIDEVDDESRRTNMVILDNIAALAKGYREARKAIDGDNTPFVAIAGAVLRDCLRRYDNMK